MSTYHERIDDFLAQKRIAVSGVSRTRQDAANGIFRKLKGAGYEVFPINPHADSFEGGACYASVGAIPGGVDGVVVVNKPEIAAQIVRECAEAGVPRVWMHRSLIGDSVSDEAVAFGQTHGLSVIDGGCPMMFVPPVDFGHKCMHWLCKVTGKLPQ